MNCRTASWAAESRLGLTSVAHMDPETSRARITAALATGTSARTWGRELAAPSRPRLARTSAMGTWRRQGRWRPTATRTSATFEYRIRPSAAPPQPPQVCREQGHRGQESEEEVRLREGHH
jgi:hypothetical protein